MVTSCSSGSTSDDLAMRVMRGRMRAPGLFIGFLLLGSSRLGAQAAITGTIKEDSSKAKLSGIEVVIQSLDRKATTDTAGRFTLAGLAHGVHILLVRGIGYQPI